MTILLFLIVVVAAASSISGGRVVQVRSYGSPGLIAGVFGCLFGLLGIFTLGIIFVPLAVLCGLVGLLRGVGAFGLAGIGTSSLALILSGIGFMTSPILWAMTASLLAGYVALSGSTHLPFRESYPHVVAGVDGNTWKPEDGYVWLRQPPNGDLRVRWEPGRLSENLTHLVTASTEGRWLPDDGYVWNLNPPPPGQFGVHWNPGQSSTRQPHLVAAMIEGRWLPNSGYKWVVDPPPPGDLRVESLSPPKRQTDAQHSVGSESLGYDRCKTISVTPVPSAKGGTVFEGHAVCGPAPCMPYERVGAHWSCPHQGGTPIGRREYIFGPQRTKWKLAGESFWHLMPQDSGDRYKRVPTGTSTTPFIVPTGPHLSAEQVKAGCSISLGELLCPETKIARRQDGSPGDGAGVDRWTSSILSPERAFLFGKRDE